MLRGGKFKFFAVAQEEVVLFGVGASAAAAAAFGDPLSKERMAMAIHKAPSRRKRPMKRAFRVELTSFG